jgi:hypothetical protein
VLHNLLLNTGSILERVDYYYSNLYVIKTNQHLLIDDQNKTTEVYI